MINGTWNNEACAIDIDVTDLAERQLLVMMTFSESGRKQLAVFRIDETTGQPEDSPYIVCNNSDAHELQFGRMLPAGAYRIRPAFSTEGWPGTPPDAQVTPREIIGHDAQGTPFLKLFAWDFEIPGANGTPEVEQSAITLILVDNKVGVSGLRQTVKPGE